MKKIGYTVGFPLLWLILLLMVPKEFMSKQEISCLAFVPVWWLLIFVKPGMLIPAVIGCLEMALVGYWVSRQKIKLKLILSCIILESLILFIAFLPHVLTTSVLDELLPSYICFLGFSVSIAPLIILIIKTVHLSTVKDNNTES